MAMISVMIPTKNRPDLVKQNLEHLQRIEFSEFDVTVIENSDSSTVAEELSRAFPSGRIRVIRTGGLSMPDNWETAYREAMGDYVFVIGDKILINPAMFEIVAQRIREKKPDVMIVQTNNFRSLPNVEFEASGWAVYQSEYVIENSLRHFDIGLFNLLAPMGYKSIISKTTLNSVQKRFGRISFPVSPDYTSAYCLLLAEVELHSYKGIVNELLVDAPSNGRSTLYDGALAKSFFDEIGTTKDKAVGKVPIKIFTIHNSLLNDFFVVADMADKKYGQDWLNTEDYVCDLFKEMMFVSGYLHLDQTDKLKQLYSFMEQNNLFSSKKINKLLRRYDWNDRKTSGESVSLKDIANLLKLYVRKKLSIGRPKKDNNTPSS